MLADTNGRTSQRYNRWRPVVCNMGIGRSLNVSRRSELFYLSPDLILFAFMFIQADLVLKCQNSGSYTGTVALPCCRVEEE